MSESDRPKPLPARPPSEAVPNGASSPPLGVDSTAEGGPVAPRGGTPEARGQGPAGQGPPAGGENAGVERVELKSPEGAWVVRVLGRSGRSTARAAPLMLVGFWPDGSAAAAPTLEAVLAARRLEDVPEETLRSALARAKEPPPAGQRRPFFEDADSTRRSGGGSEY